MNASDIPIAEGVKAPLIQSVTMVYTGPLRFGKPIVLYSVDAASAGKADRGAVYLARIVLHPIPE